MARYLDRLGQLATAASAVADITRVTETRRFPVPVKTHLYIHTAHSEVRVSRHSLSEIVITAHLQPPFAWKIGAEQDEIGVYFVALRKAVVGVIAVGKFEIALPYDAHLVLKLEDVRLVLDQVSDTLDFPGRLQP